MRYCFIVCALLCAMASNGQTRENPTIIRLDYRMEVTSDSLAFSYYEWLWQENGLWKGQLYNFPENQLLRSRSYTQADRKTKTGVTLSFHANGTLSDSGYYQNDNLQGIFKTWYDDGMPKSVAYYHNGLPTDTAIFWHKDGTVSGIRITDSLGNGKQQWMDASGKVSSIGRLKAGQRAGKWLFKQPDGTVEMEVMFDHDTATVATCFDAGGAPLNGACIYERDANFPGGLSGWKRFLERNLKYPDAAINAEIMGTVKIMFEVAEDGQLSNFKVVSSPAEVLSAEALRIMRKSPPWQPAIQLNKPVKTKQIQSVGFYLQ